MINTVTDFKLAESVLRTLCQDNGCIFKDTEISFGEDKLGSLSLGEPENVAHTIYKIIDQYLRRSLEIIGSPLIPDEREKDDFLIGLSNYLRGIVYTDSGFGDHLTGLHYQSLYQRPFVWVIMKDIICPVYDKPLKNIKIVCGMSPYIDIARFYDKDELRKVGKRNKPFIFVNIVDNIAIQSAYLLIEALKGHELSPMEVIRDIYDGELYEKFYGLLKLSLNSEKNIIEFENVLLNSLGIQANDEGKSEKSSYLNRQKVAQNLYPETSSQWWYLGIAEKLLDPVRGNDWSTYYNLEGYVEDFWNKVEKLRKKKANKGKEWTQLPFDKLLEMKVPQTTDYKNDPNKTLQHMLADNRIW